MRLPENGPPKRIRHPSAKADGGAAVVSQQIVWKPVEGVLTPHHIDEYGNEQKAAWAPQPGSQVAFLACPIEEILIEGNRGGGKTDVLIVKFCQYVGKGLGAAWVGIIFRQTYPELDDIKRKCRVLLPSIFGDRVKENKQSHTWTWDTGEQLLFRHAKSEDDYQHYHGANVPFIGFEELTTWADPAIYLLLQSINRPPKAGVPCFSVSTTNPYGPGHGWVKRRWRLPLRQGMVIGPIIDDSVNLDGELERPRIAIHSSLFENKVLLHAKPNYLQTLASSARNKAQLRAWVHGDWTVAAGGMLDDCWDVDHHNLPPFEIPATWRIDRAFDWGSSRPFSVGWWAESDGSSIRLKDGRTMRTLRGDLFLVREWYGTTGEPNKGLQWTAKQISEGIVEREVMWRWRQPGLRRSDCVVRDGPADSAIFNVENGVCIADDMEEKVTLKDGQQYRGVTWDPADKRPGSRKLGWEAIRQALKNALPYCEVEQDGKIVQMPRPREFPGVFAVGEHCPYWIEHVPNLPRDKKDPDDVDTEAEDHDGDMTRYRVRQMGSMTRPGRTTGSW